ATVYGGGVNDWLEERAHLSPRLSRAIELAAREVEPAHQRPHLAGFVVDCQQRPLDKWRLLEPEHLGDVALEFAHFYLDHIANLEETGRGRAPGPLERGSSEIDFVTGDPHSGVGFLLGFGDERHDGGNDVAGENGLRPALVSIRRDLLALGE